MINGRFVSWKKNLLNRSCCVTLAKSVVTVVLIYDLQNIWLPYSIFDNIDVIVHSFIWRIFFCHSVKESNWAKITLWFRNSYNYELKWLSSW